MKGLEFKPKLFTMMKTYTKADLMTDLMAGIIVGIVALPLAIAFGIASGVSPEKESSQPLWPVLSSRFWEEARYRLADRPALLSSSFMVSSSSTESKD